MQITISSLLLGQSSFFALGNSNAISSIDLSNAYNAISGFNVVGVGILTFLSNWAGPVWWSITAIKMLIEITSPVEEKESARKKKKGRDWVKQEFDNLLPSKPQHKVVSELENPSPFANHIALLTLFTAASLLAVMIACTVLRTHLFIWTVFSPKYLFAMAWSLGFHLLITLGLGGGLWALCG
jgi:ethanolaminephosphotransferase